MAGLLALSLLAAPLGAAPQADAASAHRHTAVSASAQAFVRILPGAKISLSSAEQPEGYKQADATIVAEDGTRRPAKLVEFQ